MLNVLAACGNGMGSSQLIVMRIKDVLNELGLEYNVDHSSVGMGKSQAKNYDLVIVPILFVKDFTDVPETTKIVGLVNLLSADEIRTKVKEALGL